MKLKKILIILSITFIMITSIFYITTYLKKTNIINIHVEDNNTIVEIADTNNLKIEENEKVKLNVKIADIFKTSNKLFKWKSTNEDVATVDDNGVVTTKNSGNAKIICKLNNQTVETNLTVYSKKLIVILVGDSRMDHFKDDNEFNKTDKYEIKYTDKKGIFSTYERLYVVSLSGMRHNWLVGEDEYKNENATKYVSQIIREYENKTNDTTQYEIKILFNLGVNDITDRYLGDNTPTDISKKYLNTLEENMNNEWSSDIIDKISLNMITLLPIQDEQVKCYSNVRYNKYVIEFNEYTRNNYQGKICDIYNDLKFNDNVFREKAGHESCATRDGLHFSKEFNTKDLYSYIINYCSNK